VTFTVADVPKPTSVTSEKPAPTLTLPSVVKSGAVAMIFSAFGVVAADEMETDSPAWMAPRQMVTSLPAAPSAVTAEVMVA
jgi:hypothetical protein